MTTLNLKPSPAYAKQLRDFDASVFNGGTKAGSLRRTPPMSVNPGGSVNLHEGRCPVFYHTPRGELKAWQRHVRRHSRWGHADTVRLTYDPADMSRVHVYAYPDHRYLCTAIRACDHPTRPARDAQDQGHPSRTGNATRHAPHYDTPNQTPNSPLRYRRSADCPAARRADPPKILPAPPAHVQPGCCAACGGRVDQHGVSPLRPSSSSERLGVQAGDAHARSYGAGLLRSLRGLLSWLTPGRRPHCTGGA